LDDEGPRHFDDISAVVPWIETADYAELEAMLRGRHE
jgi:hypothetical protein